MLLYSIVKKYNNLTVQYSDKRKTKLLLYSTPSKNTTILLYSTLTKEKQNYYCIVLHQKIQLSYSTVLCSQNSKFLLYSTLFALLWQPKTMICFLHFEQMTITCWCSSRISFPKCINMQWSQHLFGHRKMRHLQVWNTSHKWQ